MNVQLSIIKSKLLKQTADYNTSTSLNMLDLHIFKTGNQITIDNIISNTFTKIDNTVPTLSLPSGSYFFDVMDGFKLKDYTNKIVTNGYYRLKSNITHNIIGKTGWLNTNYYVYYVCNGIPTKFASEGYYVDLDHSILTYVDNTGISNDVPNGYYYYDNPYCLFISTNNIITNIPDGIYDITFSDINIKTNNIIYNINNGIVTLYNNYYINLSTNNYYNNQKLYGTCNIGTFIITDDKLLIKTNNGWKFIELQSLFSS